MVHPPRSPDAIRTASLALALLLGLATAAAAQIPIPLASLDVSRGGIVSGDLTSLATADQVWLVVSSGGPPGSKAKKMQATDWFVSAIVPDDTVALRVTISSQASQKVKQTLYLWRWKSSKWKPIQNAQVGTGGLLKATLVDSAFHYVSLSGEVRVRVCSEGKKIAYTHATDLLQLEVLPAGSKVESKPMAVGSGGAAAGLELLGGPAVTRGMARFAVSGDVRGGVLLFDVRGRTVVSLQSYTAEGGRNIYIWDGRNAHGSAVARGVYFARVQSGSRVATQRVLWLQD